MSQTDKTTALDLPMVDPLPESTAKYFGICEEKLGMVPNVLKAHAFDINKLNACRLPKVRRKYYVMNGISRMTKVAGLLWENYPNLQECIVVPPQKIIHKYQAIFYHLNKK